ncbi:ribosome biogenesis GTPase Der [Desulfurispira natronophila]|uniref:GTPase Der n=1 Tax=Desulfurispira natronophila TaxID=682562 RepID=A0A7W7Y4A7_9BACT|nr:ribosome biogenesis GTPase Der [Desulfurispira natronophila]MBB5021773.1 GTP-binding protein [Desulfurispira natronophila]
MKKKPIVSIIGRPNVGKSTLFNRLARKRIAIVEDTPGVTRDRNYYDIQWENRPFTIVDTGGFESEVATDSLESSMVEQTKVAIEEADVVVFLLDGITGVAPDDQVIMDLLRRTEKPVFVVANKLDTPRHEDMTANLYELGVDKIFAVSASHGRGIGELLDELTQDFPLLEEYGDVDEEEVPIRLAIIGRPNVGKSSLINTLCGENRAVASPVPGTTRDTLHTAIRHNGRDFILLDTAGIRRKSRAFEHSIERYSVFRSIAAIEEAHVVLLLVDAQEPIADQDLKVASYAWEAGKPVIIGVNKWDIVDKDDRTYLQYQKNIQSRFKVSSKPCILFLSALTGQRTHKIYDLAEKFYRKTRLRIPTTEINELIQKAAIKHPPPSHTGGKRVKFFYATQISRHPFIVVIFCNYPESVHFSYKRYLTNVVTEAYSLHNVPVILKFRKKKASDKEHHEN